MSIKYFCDDCDIELDMTGASELIENDRLDWGELRMTIYPDALSLRDRDWETKIFNTHYLYLS